jgi:hypothetical protein
MYEEGHALAQLVHTWQLVVRHPALFFPYRSQFMPQMVNSLNRLGLPPNCPVENRQLAVGLADLIVNWEYEQTQLKQDESSDRIRVTPGDNLSEHARDTMAHKSCRTGTAVGSVPLTRSDGEFHLTMTMVEMVANFLVRLALFTSDNKEPAVQHLAPRCLFLFRTTLQAWPNSHIRFSYFEKLIATTNTRLDTTVGHEPPYSPTLLYTCLDIVHITLGVTLQPNTFFIDNVAKVQLLICPCFYIPNNKIQTKLRSVIGRIAEVYPPGRSYNSTTFFYQQIKYVVESRLILAMENHFPSNKPDDWANCLHLISKVFPVVKMIDSICMHSPAYVGNHGHQLLRLCQILVFHHLNSARSTAVSQEPICCATPIMSALTQAVGLALKCNEDEPQQTETCYDDAGCDIIGTTSACLLLLTQAVIDHSSSHVRRELIVLIFVCLERSNSTKLLLLLSKLVCDWLTNVKSPLSRCEKNAFVEHMLDIDDVTIVALQPLFARFLCINNPIPRALTCRETKRTRPRNLEYLLQPLRSKNFSAFGLLAIHPGVRAAFHSVLIQEFLHDLSHNIIHLLHSDWSPLSNRFWIVILIEVILDGLDANNPLQLTLESVRMPTLRAEIPLETPAMLAGLDVSLQRQYSTARECLLLRSRSLQNFVEPLKELVHAHLGLAEKAWISFLPLISNSIDKLQQGHWQIALANAIFQQFRAPYHRAKLQVSTVLPGTQTHMDSKVQHSQPVVYSKRYQVDATTTNTGLSNTNHDSFFYGSTQAILSPLNVPQALIEVCTLFPQFLVPDKGTNKLMKILLNSSSKYNCHYAALQIIEQVIMLRQDSLVRSLRQNPRILCSPLFFSLQELDIRVDVLNDVCMHPMSPVAFALRRYGLIPRAQDAYLSNMVSELNQKDTENLHSETSVFEVDIWCVEWLGCARDMSQWVLLRDLFKYASSPLPGNSSQPMLMLEAYWKTHQWGSVREHLAEAMNVSIISSGIKQLQGRTPHMKLLQTRLAVAEGLHSEVDVLCGECIQLALESWGNLPKLHLGIATHDRLLHLFHELIEIHESSQLLHEAFQHSRALTYPDLRTVARTWRNRLPNDWDSMSDWDDILKWREYIYILVRKAFCWGPLDAVLRLHDAPWTTVSLARIARKQGLIQTSCGGNCMRDSKEPSELRMNLDDAFSSLRERILACYGTADTEFTGCYRNSSMGALVQTSLYLINTTSAEPFHAEQRAELFRLKGIFLGSLGRCRDSHQAFSAATRACNLYGRAWYSWAVMCDVNSITESSCLLLNRLLLNSFVCHVAAIECGYQCAVVCGLARVLLLLRLSKQSDCLGTQLYAIPNGVWIPWIPQIMLMLDILGVKGIFVSLLRTYPQAIYYSLRANLLHQHSDNSSRILLHQMMTHFHETNSPLASEMDFVGDKVVVGTQPSPAEELINILNCIQTEKNGILQDQASILLYRLLLKTSTRYTGRGSLRSKGCETTWANHSGALLVAKSNSVASFVSRYVTRSIAVPEYPRGFRTLSRHLHKLKTALTTCAVQVVSRPNQNRTNFTLSKTQFEEQKFCKVRHLIYCSAPPLEVPGQFSPVFGILRPELHLPLLHIEPATCHKIEHGCFQRRFKFISDEGRGRIFSCSIISPSNARTGERVDQFLGVFDYALTHCRISQQRRLRASARVSVTFGPNLKMIEDMWSWTSLSEIEGLKSAVLKPNQEYIVPYTDSHVRALFLKARAVGRPPCACERNARRAAYNNVCANKASHSILMNHIHATLNNIQATWTFRRTCATQLAIPSVLSFILAVANCGAQETMICQYTGRVYLDNIRPRFSSFHVRSALHRAAGLSEPSSDAVPFRLTRNIERILQPFLLNSIMKSTVGAILIALRTTSNSGGLLEPYINLFLLDEMTSAAKDKTQNYRPHVADEKQLLMNRLTTTAPSLHSQHDICIEAGLNRLIELAQSPDCIALNELQWLPWL